MVTPSPRTDPPRASTANRIPASPNGPTLASQRRPRSGRLTESGEEAWARGAEPVLPTARFAGSPADLSRGVAPSGWRRRVRKPGRALGPRRRRRRAIGMLLVLACTTLVVVDLARGGGAPPSESAPPVTTPAAAGPAPSRGVNRPPFPARPDGDRLPDRTDAGTAGGAAEIDFPLVGSGAWSYVTRTGPVLGHAGRLLRFRIAVEAGAGQDPAAFSRAVDEVLGDPRSWTGAGRLRMQQVAKAVAADFTVLLATPGTSERVCASGGLRTDRYTNCRLPGRVVINLARWWGSVPGYGAPLAEYQAYVVNHEVGHQLGYGHELCPGPGRPAPVMQQQTLGLQGCTAYGWPYLDGHRYAGPPVT